MASNGGPAAHEPRELAALFEAGDTAACMRWLFDAFAKTLLAYFVTITRSRDEAEELLQDVFLSWAQRLEDFDPRSIAGFGGGIDDLRNWVIACARNVWLKRLDREAALRRGGNVAHHALEFAAAAPSPTQAPPEQIENRERADRLRAALAQLAPDDQRLLHLLYFEQLPVAEIAAKLGIGVAAATSRLHRARARCRRALDGDPQRDAG
ncbi:MAG: sigma-70 family RNA polymerase sigma factor [Planctomycetota bacterium]